VLLSQERSPTLHAQTLALCAKHGFDLRIVQTVPEVTTAVALVRAGLELTMIPGSFGTGFAGVRFHRLDDKEARWSVGAAWRKGDTNRAGAVSVVAGGDAIVDRVTGGKSVKFGVMLGPNGQMAGLDCPLPQSITTRLVSTIPLRYG
jgi:hypothetical protein